MEILGKLEWAVEAVELGFVASVLKQAEKINKGDLEDIKDSDIAYIKALYPAFEGKTEATDIAYALIIANFGE